MMVVVVVLVILGGEMKHVLVQIVMRDMIWSRGITISESVQVRWMRFSPTLVC